VLHRGPSLPLFTHDTQAINNDVGPRELTVRQMLHSAALRSRQPAITAAAADHLVRLSTSAFEESAANSIKGISPPGSVFGTSPRAPRAPAHSTQPAAGGGGGAAGDVERGERGWPLESIGSNVAGSFRDSSAAAATAAAPAHADGASSGGVGTADPAPPGSPFANK
jgi:hypothetical protein